MFTKVKHFFDRSSFAAVAAVFTLAMIVANVAFPNTANAAQITTRSLALSSSANGNQNVGAAGTGTNGANANYKFTFTVPGAASTVQSMDFQFCSSALPGTACNLPTAMSVTSAALGTGGNAPTGLTGWALGTAGNAPTNTATIDGGTGGRIRITRTNAVNVASDTIATVTFTGIKNPVPVGNDNYTFYSRLVTYTDTAYTTSRDSGTVANSTAQQIDITAKVQETLNFSVGSTVTSPNGNTCSPFNDTGALTLGDSNGVLSFAQAYDGHSYFRVSTNAGNGTKVYYSGDTLKSGSNSITAIGTTAAASDVGASQFGLAVDSSDTQGGSGYSFTNLTATSPYGSGNGTIVDPGGTAQFAYSTASLTAPVEIASATGTITCDTGSVRYLANIATTTPPGIYTTTVTYLAVPVF